MKTTRKQLGFKEILRKLDLSEIVLISGYSRALFLNEWRRHIDDGKIKVAKGWITGKDLKVLLGLEDAKPTGKVYIDDDEEVYLAIFRDGKLKTAVVDRDARKPVEVESIARSALNEEHGWD
jgi:hypothetical protein